MKKTLQTKFLSIVVPYTVDGIISPDEYKSTLKSLHTEAVTRAIASHSPNKVLHSLPPVQRWQKREISPPSPTFHPLPALFWILAFNSFLHRVNRAEDSVCPS